MPFDGIRNSALVRTLADVLEDLPDLFRKEMRLAQAEFTEKIKGGVQASARSHSKDSRCREDVQYWVMAWGWGPWHNKYAWF
jgi:hypothetical protein